MIKDDIVRNQDWDVLIDDLMLYAANKAVKKPSWRKVSRNECDEVILAQGKGLYDVVLEALQSVFTEKDEAGKKRAWNMETSPDLIAYIKSAIDSILSNLVNSSDNKQNENDPLDNSVISDDKINPAFSKSSISPSENDLVNKIFFQDFDKRLSNLIKNDKQLEDYYILVLSDLKRREIADEMKISVDDVTNLQKRLHRMLLKAAAELGYNSN